MTQSSAAAKRLVLILRADDPATDPVRRMLQALAPDVSLDLRPDLSGLVPAEGTFVVLPVAAPALAVARQIEAGADPETALSQWETETTALLAQTAPLRRSLALVDETALVQGDPACWAALATRLGLGKPQAISRDDTRGELPDPMLMAGAAMCLQMSETALDLAAGLAALRVGPQEMLFGKDTRAQLLGKGGPAYLIREIGLLRETLQLQIDALERSEQDLQTLREAENATAKERHLMQARLDAAARRLEDAERQHNQRETVLARQMLKDGQAVESLETRLETARQQAAENEARIAELEAELTGVYGSASWRVTGGMRAIRRGLSSHKG